MSTTNYQKSLSEPLVMGVGVCMWPREWWTEVINLWHPTPSSCSLSVLEKYF